MKRSGSTSGVLRLPRLFLIWLALFYGTWLAILVIGGYLGLAASNWPIAAAMGAGSYFAGSTPMGGGTVGFPVLVLLFDQSPSLGRDFSLAIQAIGMTSAGIYILASRKPLAWSMFVPALIAGAVSTVINLLFISDHVPPWLVEIAFASLWVAFGILMLIKMRSIVETRGIKPVSPTHDRVVGTVVGLLGGVLVGITGIGIDMLIFSALTVFSRASLRIAIPTSVVLMAAMSLVGTLTKSVTGTWDPQVWGNWLAASPVVALGAPFGAIVVALVNRRFTLIVVSLLCIIQYVWTVWAKEIWGAPLVASAVAVIAFNYIAHRLYEKYFPRSERRQNQSSRHIRRWGR